MFKQLWITACCLVVASTTLVAADPKSRPFHLGFTRWPADLTLDGYLTALDFAHRHGDIVSVMFIGGIPWPEALAGKPFSKDVQNNFANRPPKGKKLFLSISPLDKERKNLAPYWGEKDNLPLPKDWANQDLNSAMVKKAYLSFCDQAIQKMKPDWLAIGVESNVLLSNNNKKWSQLKELHQETYTALKKKYPNLPICFTTEIMHYKKLATEAKSSDQVGQVTELMQYSDLFAMSLYPHMSLAMPKPIPADFLSFARDFKKPIAVSESGMTSQNVELKSLGVTLLGSPSEQQGFIEYLFQNGIRDQYEFIINFATTDFEKLCNQLPPPLDDLARIWAFTGLQASDKKAKPALATWDKYLRLHYKRD